MKITAHKPNGIRLDFDNGVSLSTIWGNGTYSDNHDYDFNHPEIDITETYRKLIETGSTTVEFMFLDGDDKLINKMCKKYGSDDNPSGYIKVSKWIEMIAYLNKIDIKL